MIAAAVLAVLLLVSAAPDDALSARFERTRGWTGGDGAHSVDLGDGNVLWLFGDTFTGEVRNGRRVGLALIHNSAAVQDRKSGAFDFWWRSSGNVLAPDEPDQWYWPGDMWVWNGRLHLFAMRVKRKPDGPPGFDFEVTAWDLLRVDRPADHPDAWEVTRLSAPAHLDLGAACLRDGEWVYAYGLAHGTRRLIVARSRLDRVDEGAWEAWTAAGWRAAGEPLAMFDDAAPEMSVSVVPGVPGYVAVYSPGGLSADIMARHALRPEGPWSAPQRLYRCPEALAPVFTYGARAHPEQSSAEGVVVVTYNCNTPRFQDHADHPEIYRPRAIRVRLRWSREG